MADAPTVPGAALTAEARIRPHRAPEFAATLRVASVPRPVDPSASLRWMISDATETHRSADELRRALDDLEDRERLKNAFLLGVAHDLRAPVLAIDAVAHAVLQEAEPNLPLRLRQALAAIAANARRLRAMENDLLDLERLGRGAVHARRRPTDLAEIVDQVMKRVDLRGRPVEIDVDDATVLVDPGMLVNMLAKLVENAANHTPEGTTVWLRASLDEGAGTFTLVVEDNGPGVSLGEEAFDLFRQGPSELGPGIGAGLFLVRRFAELHGGRAELSERPGGGASFEVVLPQVTEEA